MCILNYNQALRYAALYIHVSDRYKKAPYKLHYSKRGCEALLRCCLLLCLLSPMEAFGF